MEKEVKIIKIGEIEAIQPLKPGCHEKWILDKKTPTENFGILAYLILVST